MGSIPKSTHKRSWQLHKRCIVDFVFFLEQYIKKRASFLLRISKIVYFNVEKEKCVQHAIHSQFSLSLSLPRSIRFQMNGFLERISKKRKKNVNIVCKRSHWTSIYIYAKNVRSLIPFSRHSFPTVIFSYMVCRFECLIEIANLMRLYKCISSCLECSRSFCIGLTHNKHTLTLRASQIVFNDLL